MTNPDDLVTEAFSQSADGHVSTLGSWGVSALTKRELFAAMASTNSCFMYVGKHDHKPDMERTAKECVEFADALIKALNA